MYSHIEILHKEHLVWLGLEPVIVSEISIGWKTCDFVSFLTVFQSYQDDLWVIMKGCVQWNPV